MFRPKTIALSLVTLSLGAIAGLLAAGPLNPPAGPVAGTYKTLTEVEPRIAINSVNTPGDADSSFKITQPGSYYLTANITGSVGKHGIEIVASGVTLDLNGFDLVGALGMGAFDGVHAGGTGLTGIAVTNGSIRGWGQDGINLGDTGVAEACRVDSVLAAGNARVGIYGGVNSQLTRCSGTDGTYGLYVRSSSSLLDCSASGNSSDGITTDSGTTLSNCSSGNNAGAGFTLFPGCTASNCAAYGNTGSGINTSSAATLTNCVTYQNTGNGIDAFTGSTISHCTSYDNSGHGITVSTGCTVIDSTTRSNTLDGIHCGSISVIRGNACTSNGSGGDGAGINATGTDNRIEGNTCASADPG